MTERDKLKDKHIDTKSSSVSEEANIEGETDSTLLGSDNEKDLEDNKQNLRDEILSLEEINHLKAENKKMLDALYRSQADKDNLAKTKDKEIEKAKQYSISSFALKVVDVFEDFGKAFSSLEGKESLILSNSEFKGFFEGIKIIKSMLAQLMDAEGIKRIKTAEKEFNPDYHQVVKQIDVSNKSRGAIIEVLSNGYTINGRLLRPAMVVIASGNESSTQ